MHGSQGDSYGTPSGGVKSFALQLGFDVCGIASAEESIDPADALAGWLGSGFHGAMTWLSRTAKIRVDVRRKLPGVASVVVVARNYYSVRPPLTRGSGRVARYAWGRDYHRVLRRPLIELARYLDRLEPGAQSYASIDTGPILERAWAARAGVASIGKNSLGIRRDMGSWFFLATVLTTVKLTPDEPSADLCGTCTLCIDACPTAAIVRPYVVDARRCISYQTIENRGDVPEELHAGHGDWVFGCDVCQEVCPWNRFARETTATAFHPRAGCANPNLDELSSMDELQFNQRFAGSAIRRAQLSGIKRNAGIVKRNMERAHKEANQAAVSTELDC